MARVQPPLTPLLPLLLPLAGVFAAGLCLTALQSLGLLLPLGGDGPTPEHYAAVLGSPAMRRSAAFTLYVSAASALGSVPAGTALGYMVWRLPRRLRQTAVVYKTGLVLPHVAAAFLVLLFFGQTGLLASVANRLGLAPTPQDFPQLLFAGDGLGMILAYMYKGTPFAMLMVLAVLFGFDTRLLQTAAMLGAGPCETFRRVTLPRLLPAMHGAFIILFLYAFGAFDIPFLLGESRPGMLSMRVYDIYFQQDLADRPRAMAVLTLMFAFTALFTMLYNALARRVDDRGRKL
jgi:putative spermidine/putrescine transport system permease protein